MSVASISVTTSPTLLAAASTSRKSIVIQNGASPIYVAGIALGSTTLTTSNGLLVPAGATWYDDGDFNESSDSLGPQAKMARGPYYALTASGTSTVVVHTNE